MAYFTEYIRAELLILVPVLYFLGVVLKKASFLEDRWIPLLLGGIGITLCVIYGIATAEFHTIRDGAMMLFTAVTQGVMVSGTSVFCNQIYKQARKNESDDTNNLVDGKTKKNL